MTAVRRTALQEIIIACCLALASRSALATRIPRLSAGDLFKQTALVFIGTAREAPEICKGVDGPCTGVAFVDLEIVAGKHDRKQPLSFAMPQGPLLDGTSLKIAGAPEFTPGNRYLVFVRAGNWHLTPVTNWHHTAFRELKLGARPVSLFVNDEGLAVTGFDDNGVVLGQRIAAPNQLARGTISAGGGRSGPAASQPPLVDAKVRQALASKAPDAVDQLGMPKEKLLETISRYAARLGLNQTDPVRSRPQKPGASDPQASPRQADGGLGRAAPAPNLERKEGPPKGRGRDLEPKSVSEKPGGAKSTPGRDVDPRGSEKGQ